MVHVHAIHEVSEEDGAGGSGHILINYDCERSVVMSGWSLGPRSSGAVNIVSANGNPSFAGPPLALEKRVRLRTSAGGAANEWARRAQDAMARNRYEKLRAVVRNRC